MTADYRIAILGAGFAGLCMGLRLKAQGETSFVILEKAHEVGGAWRENTYPGCGCDIPSHLYSYSFEPNPDWPEVYSAQPDILAYIKSVAEKHGLYSHLRFNSEVTGASWDEAAGSWRISTADGGSVTAEAFVTAWGQLNRPKLPPIEGRDDFAGPSFHSARWDSSVDLAGKRVAVVGNGASAIQFVPEVAKLAGQLTLFQRSPNWIVPRMSRPYTPEEKARFRAEPAAMQAVRDEIFEMAEARLVAKRAGTLPVEEVPIPLAHLHAQVADPDLRAKLTPDYEVGCKRVLISNDFYPALTRPNVELVVEAIACMTPEGVVDATGRLHEADVVIYATGFETKSFVGDTAITGLSGASLGAAWAQGPEAYLGITVAGFPNLFLLYGPNTNLGHNSIIYMIEAQVEYVLQALAQGVPVAVKAEAMVAYNARLQDDLAVTPWAGNCTSWYKTPEGKILNNWPGTARAYAEAVARFDAGAYEVVKLPEPAE
ncbi:MAG: NAD(P)/FAD-dependent oxidoreductase [Phenylobacterium sp.]|uniref:flavin-containing monooxygenase n=1 Tax=Phenylobacterium sp. TaxID=1871053 RepID=UPI0027344086|nr:NAD(P)/FAD-dependent oxidoreductase [Phenylobacterium sp.]MDP3749428.1 NAD(P)/FAD-dependent oxidoreductase [Phenylobacterium sp.]